jgi:hypothetical protein
VTTLRRLMAIHEAGHAIVGMYLGEDVLELRLDVPEGDPELPDGGAYCLKWKARRPRAVQACSSLGGLFACALFCRDFEGFAELNNWTHCHEDLRLFNLFRGGMTYRQGRRIALGILRECETGVRRLADVLERDGFVDHTNAPLDLLPEEAP